MMYGALSSVLPVLLHMNGNLFKGKVLHFGKYVNSAKNSENKHGYILRAA